MLSIPKHLEVTITGEVLSIPFKTPRYDFLISAFEVERAGRRYECVCLHHGDLTAGCEGIPVRIHSGCTTGDVFQSLRCDCAWQLEYSLQYIADSSAGLLIYLPMQDGRGNGILQHIKSFLLMDQGLTTADAFSALGVQQDRRDYTPALVALYRLGVTKIQLITNNPAKIHEVQTAGLQVIRRIPCIMRTTDPHVLNYMRSKALQLGHLIEGI